MIKNSLILTFLFVSIIVNSQDWLYSSQFGGDGNNKVATSATDSVNVYTLGTFDGNVDDIGNSWGFRDIYLEKYSFDLNLQWRKRFGSDQEDFLNYKGLQYSDDYLYFTGTSRGDCKFDTDTAFNTGITDAFGAKYNKNGSIAWAKNIAWGNRLQWGHDIEVVDNLIYFSGAFIDSMYVGDSINAANIVNINSSNGKDLFILTYDIDGNYIDNYIINTTHNNCLINSTTHIGSDLYVSGYFSDTIFFGNDTLVSGGGRDIFLMKYNQVTGYQWARRIGGDLEDNIFTITKSSTDIFISGYFMSSDLTIDSTTTDLSTQTLTCKGDRDLISLKYSIDGTFQKVFTWGTSNRDELYGSSFKNNNLLLSGGFSDSLIVGNDTLRSVGGEDAFFVVFDENYNALSSASVGGTSADISYAAEIDFDNNFVINGRFNSDTLFIRSEIDANNIDTMINVNVGNYDSFVAKYGCRPDIYPQFTVDTITCPGNSDGNASVLITNGTDTIIDTWTYSWNTGATTDTILNISDGNYIVTVTSPKGCEYKDSVFVTNFPVLQTSLSNDTLTVDCEASTDGMAIVTPSLGYQGTTGYSYSWDTGTTDSTVTNLTIGTHYVTVQDACGSTTEVVDTINVGHLPTLQAHIETQNVMVLCDTSNNGIGRVDYTDGKAPYSFYWSGSDADTTSAVANDLNVGWHYVTITDYCNIEIIDSVMIVNMPTISGAFGISNNATCVGIDNGGVTVHTQNGIEPFIYTWSSSASDSSSANDLAVGMQYITVSDICHEFIDSVEINVNPLMEIDFTNITNTNCTSSTDGSAEVILTNEQGTVTYLWSNDSTYAINNALASGYAYVSVSDLCGTIVDSILISSKPALTAGTVSTDNLCNSDSLGTATISTLNEFGTVQFTWAELSDTTAFVDSLIAGTYHYTVTDECNDVVSDSVTIISPQELKDSVVIVNETVYGNADGSATLIVSGGTTPYIITWDNNNIGSSNNYLSDGTYHYTIRDANNCELTDSVVIKADEYSVTIYNAFTPNGDGTNDVWNIKNIDKFPEATVKVFNQWGAVVFTSDDGYAEAWDGTMDGKELPAGTYYYVIVLGEDNMDKSGSVTIIK